MRKIAAHYWLRPDGSVGKFPIITFDGDNRIVEIRERDAFKEEASLLLINGFLIPGLVEYSASLLPLGDPSALKKYLNKMVIRGVRVLALPKATYTYLKGFNQRDILLVETEAIPGKDDRLEGFEKLQAASDSMAELLKMTVHNATAIGINHTYGSLEVGKTPGLLTISNLDYSTFCIDKNSKLKGIL